MTIGIWRTYGGTKKCLAPPSVYLVLPNDYESNLLFTTRMNVEIKQKYRTLAYTYFITSWLGRLSIDLFRYQSYNIIIQKKNV